MGIQKRLTTTINLDPFTRDVLDVLADGESKSAAIRRLLRRIANERHLVICTPTGEPHPAEQVQRNELKGTETGKR